MTKLVVISAGLSNPSSTRLLGDLLKAATVEALGDAEVTTIELRDLSQQLHDNLMTGFPSLKLADAIATVGEADGIIVVTPVFSASYSGLFKTFFDVLEEGLIDGKPVLIAATAGTARHSLVLEHAMRPLFAYLHAVVMPTGVFAATDDFGSAGLQGRIDRAAAELAARPVSVRKLVEDGFDNPTPFEELLKLAAGR